METSYRLIQLSSTTSFRTEWPSGKANVSTSSGPGPTPTTMEHLEVTDRPGTLERGLEVRLLACSNPWHAHRMVLSQTTNLSLSLSINILSLFCSGTDRTNIVETPCANCNYPIPFDNMDQAKMFREAEVLWTPYTRPDGSDQEQALDTAVTFASAGYYRCFEGSRCSEYSVTDKNQLNQLLNNAPASFEGAVLRFSRAATYYYMCSRNNNFTNRSQKGQLTVQ